MNSQQTIVEIERFIRRDPAGRGLIASEAEFGALCPGHLAEAAAHLTEFGTNAIIVTGFYIPHATPPACETDGPLGALLLASVLMEMDVPPIVVTDEHCLGAIRASAEFVDFPEERIATLSGDSAEWLPGLIARHGEQSHLIAVERAGPSHTAESIRLQYAEEDDGYRQFTAEVTIEHHGLCRNMRGDAIDDYTPPLHRLFEEFPRIAASGKSIGIGDGGNEIGMGAIPWHDLRRRLPGEFAGRVPCRIATDWTILAGVSNWGAYALAAATALLRNRVDVLRPFDCDQQGRMLAHIIEHGPAVCGITGLQESLVDGLPFETYIQPWAGIRRIMGLSS